MSFSFWWERYLSHFARDTQAFSSAHFLSLVLGLWAMTASYLGIYWLICDIYDRLLWQEQLLFNRKDRDSLVSCSTEGSNSTGLKADMPLGDVDPWKGVVGINKVVRSGIKNGDSNLCFECRLENCVFLHYASPFTFAELEIYIFSE